ncbi:cytochrome P450 [Panus rudis PR-1116 ss-1]|nr:cytochrome P450 [Panus rudis PR-1116 ss-1]
MPTILSFVDLLCATLTVYVLWHWASRSKQPLPPGPKGLPLIGNVLDMPTAHEWLTFAHWQQKWGDIIHLNLLGQHMIILNSASHAFELLDKNSAINSDRPTLIMGGELVGWSNTLALTHYGERLREYRRFFSRFMGSKAQISRFHGLVEQETVKFLLRIQRAPKDIHAHIRRTAGAIILYMTYGYSVGEDTDHFVEHVEKTVDEFTHSTAPGAFLVDVLPVLRYLPAWFPGAGFQKIVKAWRKDIMEMADHPFELVKKQLNDGTAIPSFTSHLLETEKLNPEKEFNIKWTAASMYSGGADTTVSAIYSFFLCMTLYPEAQQKAQAEIDSVIGSDRLPGLADRDQLPYVEALVKEVFRLNPVAPLAVPHTSTEDQIYAEYFIPKGSIILANIWNFLHDPNVYNGPSHFRPERYLGANPERDPREVAFGFGRRICPGLHLADASIWLSCAMTLATYNITKTFEDGQFIEPICEYTTGTISHPVDFDCTVKPRSSKSEALLSSLRDEAN